GDVEFHLVAFGFCIFRHATAALRDAFGLRLEIFHASERFYASDYTLTFFRRDQHAHCRGDASRVVAVQLRVRNLHFLRRERFHVVVNLLDIGRIKRELRAFLEQERSRFFHVFLGERNRHRGELHLGIPIFQLTQHLLDLFAAAAEYLLHLEQVGDL